MKRIKNRILKHSAFISSGTFITRILGFFREILAAAFFGAGKLYDAFVIAFSVPNLFRRVLGEEMFERAFVPRFRRLVAEKKQTEGRKFIIKTFLITSVIAFIITIGLYPFVADIVKILAPGMESQTYMLTVRLTKIILPFILLISFSTFAGAILLFSGRSFLYSTAPGFMNIIVILFIIFFHRKMGVTSLCIGYLIGASGFFLYQLPAVLKIFRSLKTLNYDLKRKGKEVSNSLKEGGKIFFASTISKAVQVVDRAVASLVGSGAISSLWYGFRLIHLPFSILSLAISRSIAPELSDLKGKRDKKGFSSVIHFGIDLNLIILTPVIIFLLIFSKQVVIIFFKRGVFGNEAVGLTTIALFYYSLAIIPMGISGFIARVYSSLEDNKVPLFAALFGGGINIFLDFILYKTSLEHGGIALATAIALTIQSFILIFSLKKYDIHLNFRRIFRTFLKLIFALIFFIPLLFIVKFYVKGIENSWFILLLLIGIALFSFSIYGVIVYGFWRKRYSKKKKIILTGGGTGGHVYPSLAIYNILKKRDYISDVLYLGVKGKAEDVILPKTNIKLEYIKSYPVAGKSLLKKLTSLLKILWSAIHCLFKIIKFKPHIIVATGSYVSAPVILAGFLLKPFLKLKIVIEEQNLVPGLLNKVASLLADLVFVNYKETAYFVWSNKCVYAGYPIRKEYLKEYDIKNKRKKAGLPEDKFIILISGGSLGARSINRVLALSLKELSKIKNIYIVHIFGISDYDYYNSYEDTFRLIDENIGENFDRENFEAVNDKGEVYYKGYKYLFDIVNFQQSADLIVSRAGAGGISEIAALGKASIIIPKRGLPGDHQELNAINIAEKGGAEVIFEKRDFNKKIDYIDKEEFIKTIKKIRKNKKIKESLEKGAEEIFFYESHKIIYNSIVNLMKDEYINHISDIIEPKFVKFQRLFDSLILYLDKIIEERGKDNLYYKFYNIKVEEYLRSNNMFSINKGIKLIGSLKREDLYPWIYEDFDSFKGFLKRNSLIALSKADNYFPFFKNLIIKGLEDSYYETRREAIKLYRRFYESVGRSKKIKNLILKKIEKKFESFEVKTQAIKTSVLFLDFDKYLKTNRKFLHSNNVRLREAVLEGIEFGLKNNILPVKEKLKAFLKRMLITTSEFKPEYKVREKYLRVIQYIEGDKK